MSRRATLAILSIVLAAPGCAVHQSVPNVASGMVKHAPDGAVATNDAPEWLVLSPKFAKTLEVDETLATHDHDVLHVQMSVSNKRKDPASFETRFEWLDARGFEVRDTTEHWVPRVAHGLQTVLVEGVAPNAAVTTYRFKVRPSNELTDEQ